MAASASREAVSDEPGGGPARRVTAVLLLAAFVVAFTQGAVIPALPLFRRQLGVSASWLGGVLAGRALQGVSGGVFPLTFGLARRWTPPERLHGVIAALSAMFGVGGALAMAVAGPLAGALGTAALSLLSVLITFLALAGVLTRLPRGGAPARGGRHGTVLDLPGTLLLAASLVALLLGVTQGRTWGWGSAATLATLTGALVLGAGFAAVESRSPGPVVGPRLLRGRGPALTHLATFVISVAMFAAVTLIPQYAQTPVRAGYGFGTPAAEGGLPLAPMAVAMVVAAPLSTRLAARVGSGAAFRAGATLAATTLTGSATATPTETGSTMAFLASAAVAAVALALSAALPRKRASDGRRPTRSPSRPCAVRRTRRTRRDSAQT
ncbi:MFS transporter [Streptomyces javensis]|uniref:MFS transporter n=1 Tax=Streptomyces javensis TaxID=114698 RepID=UPI0033EF8C92